jgi:hypothetical protein
MQFVDDPALLPKNEDAHEAMAGRLSAIWITYNSGDYANLKEQRGDPFRALPRDAFVAKQRTLLLLIGPWINKKLEPEDLEHLKFTYPLRPDPKKLFRDLKRVGLCSAGNTMGLSYADVFQEEVKAGTAEGAAEFWDSVSKKDRTYPYWCFFIDGE